VKAGDGTGQEPDLLPEIPLGGAGAAPKVRPMEIIVVLLVAGAALLVLEPFFPHFVAGPVGLAAWAVAVLLTYARYGADTGNFTLLGVLAGGIGGAVFYVWQLPKSRFARPFSSNKTPPPADTTGSHLLHQSGIALSALLPGGIAEIGGRRIDVVSEGGAIDRGRTVRVIAVEGSRVVVRPT